MDLFLPPPDRIIERIELCERELKALRRLLRTSKHAYDADEARRRREQAQLAQGGGPQHG
jgi:hypothetical protein